MDLAMSEFVDFHVLTGSSRVAKVRALKGRGEYDPATDFWRPLRNAITKYHLRQPGDSRSIRDFLGPIADRRIERYESALAGYKKFLGRKDIAGFRAPSANWVVGDLTVHVNPEIGLRWSDAHHVLKLYFKAEALSRGRVQAMIALMEEVLRPRVGRNVAFAVLDVANATLRVADARSSLADTQLALRADARLFAELWGSV